MMNKEIKAIGWVVILVIFYSSLANAAETSVFKIMPPQLGIGAFFSGKDIALSGPLPSDAGIIIEIIGPQENAKFNVKGRVGPFWMNRDKVELEKAPFLYVLLLPGNKKWKNQLSSIGVGLQQVEQSIRISPAGRDRDLIFDQFIRLKRSELLYAQDENAIHYTAQNKGGKFFEATFHFPSSTVPGEYQIVATLLQNNRTVNRSVHHFQVAEVGVIKRVRELAYHHELVYGIVCVVIALFVGAVMGLFFGRSEGH